MQMPFFDIRAIQQMKNIIMWHSRWLGNGNFRHRKWMCKSQICRVTSIYKNKQLLLLTHRNILLLGSNPEWLISGSQKDRREEILEHVLQNKLLPNQKCLTYHPYHSCQLEKIRHRMIGTSSSW